VAAFDWYQATIPQPVDDVLEVLSGLAPRLLLSHERGHHGYASTAVLGTADLGPVARVWHGGSHPYPHATVSGSWAVAGAEAIRAAFPVHSVSRLDVREDYTEAGAFDKILPHLLASAEKNRIVVGTAGDHLLTKQARTVYLGAPSSAVRMRLYDKRSEVLAKLPAKGIERDRAWQRLPNWEDFPDHWTRLEAQIRPGTKESKRAFASIEPTAALGSSAWMREVWAGLHGMDLQPVQVGQPYRLADTERQYAWLLSCGRKQFLRLLDELGSWECVGKQIGFDLEQGQERG
jgi:hypothetical protein